jgi:hypothetical protein
MSMEIEDLRGAWRRQGEEGAAADSSAELRRVRERAEELSKTVARRDRLETLVAVALLPVFAWLAFRTSLPVSKAGAAIIAVACVLIPLRLRWARGSSPDPTLPTTDFLRRERERVQTQARLLRSVLYWYLAPLGIGVVLFVGGSPVAVAWKVAYAVIVTAFFGWVLHLNHRAVATELEPRLRELDLILASLEHHQGQPHPAGRSAGGTGS